MLSISLYISTIYLVIKFKKRIIYITLQVYIYNPLSNQKLEREISIGLKLSFFYNEII